MSALPGVLAAHVRGSASADAAPWNAADKHASITLSNADYTADGTGYAQSVRGVSGRATGKWYFEVQRNEGAAPSFVVVGVCLASSSLSQYVGGDEYGWGRANTGHHYHDGGGTDLGTDVNLDQIWMVAIDIDAGKLWLGRQSIWDASGDPAAGANEAFSVPVGTYYPACSPRTDALTMLATPTFTPPPGFLIWS